MSEDLQRRIDGYWDARAQAYDTGQRRDDREDADAQVWSRVWADALPEPPARVVDLGTGSGHAAYVIAALGHDVLGIDSSAGMLAQARRRRVHPGTRVPDFALGDAVDPGLPRGSVDAITSRYLMWTLRDPHAALRAWRAALRPGGVLAVVDSTWFDDGIEAQIPDFVASYAPVIDALPLAQATSISATADAVREAGYTRVTVTPLRTVLELDERLGAAPGHRPRLQHLVRGIA